MLHKLPGKPTNHNRPTNYSSTAPPRCRGRSVNSQTTASTSSVNDDSIGGSKTSGQTSPTSEEIFIIHNKGERSSDAIAKTKRYVHPAVQSPQYLLHCKIVQHVYDAWMLTTNGKGIACEDGTDIVIFRARTERVPKDFVPVDLSDYYRRRLIDELEMPFDWN